jgi:uncharacterized protein YacL (UPF0231 family)
MSLQGKYVKCRHFENHRECCKWINEQNKKTELNIVSICHKIGNAQSVMLYYTITPGIENQDIKLKFFINHIELVNWLNVEIQKRPLCVLNICYKVEREKNGVLYYYYDEI